MLVILCLNSGRGERERRRDRRRGRGRGKREGEREIGGIGGEEGEGSRHSTYMYIYRQE